MITENQFKEIADLLDIEVATIKAVTEVESKGEAFLSTGEPIILFEPHIFWKELQNKGINPLTYVNNTDTSDIVYQKWGAKPYGKFSQQHSRLARAVKINREAALKSASWGAFQIMGFNYDICGFPTVQEFVNAMYESEFEHLKAFSNFIKNTGLVKHLKTKNWEAFAKGYNGSGYKKNDYHNKLAKAYNKYK